MVGKTPQIRVSDIFFILIDSEVNATSFPVDQLTEQNEGGFPFTANAKKVAAIALSEDKYVRGNPVFEAVLAAEERQRDFEIMNGLLAAKEAGYPEEEK